MFNNISNLNPIFLAGLGGLFSFMFTSFGSAIVYFFRTVNKNIMNGMLAISAGIMISASFFSLLNPAIEITLELHQSFLLTIVFGFVVGSLFVFLGNRFFDSIKIDSQFNLKRCVLLFTSITLHNIPEGLAIGVAFGNMLYGGNLVSALTLTLGIAIQNFPEGSAISLPLRREGLSFNKSFIFGSLSGLVEPIFAVIGALLVLKINSILSFILSFAAGAMIFVTVLELIPESFSNEKKDYMAMLLIVGFSMMMILDVLLG